MTSQELLHQQDLERIKKLRVFVNGDNKDETTPLGRLMHDFHCTSADDMHYEILADGVRYFKETEGGRDSMCKLM